ncbi:MAG: putative ADP-ribose pyrophosphatase [Chloroflexi bacterium OLB15]|nr:MAG: putative ADP-ribose pyrophosphatase [Chloroflexi bacterium OLB15]
METSEISPEIPLNETQVYSGRVVNLVVVDVQLQNGQKSKRELVRHPGAVAIVAIDENDQVLLVRQYRFAARQAMIEIPAGTLNIGEDPAACAIRELQEETGCKAAQIDSLGGIFVAPGYTTEFIHLFLAKGLSESRLAMDDDEFIDVQRLPFAEALAMVDRGKIIDGKSIAALLKVARLRGK